MGPDSKAAKAGHRILNCANGDTRTNYSAYIINYLIPFVKSGHKSDKENG